MPNHPATPAQSPELPTTPLREPAALFLRPGTTAFGGPAALILLVTVRLLGADGGGRLAPRGDRE